MARARNDRGDPVAMLDDEARITWLASQQNVAAREYKAFKEQFCTEALKLLLADGGYGWLRLARALQRSEFIAGDDATAIVTGATDALCIRV